MSRGYLVGPMTMSAPYALRKNARNVTRNDRSVHASHSGRFVGNAIAVPRGIAINRVIGKAHVVVVVVDPDVRWITAEKLGEVGFTVTEADSGRAALAMLERDEPCDLIVADLMMPGLSGTDTVRLARRMRPTLKALFVSGYTERSRFEGELGSDGLLKKPFELETLVAAVQMTLHPKPDNVVLLRREPH